MIECQEPGCRHEATKDWNGMRVCPDHYDQYRDDYERVLRNFSN